MKYLAGIFLFLITFFGTLQLVVVLADVIIVLSAATGLVWVCAAIRDGRFRTWQDVTRGALGTGVGVGLVSALLIPYAKWF